MTQALLLLLLSPAAADWTVAMPPIRMAAAPAPAPETQEPEGPDLASVELGGNAELGRADAPVTIVSFGSYRCPYSGLFHARILSELRKSHIPNGLVRFVYRDFPLPKQPQSRPAAEASECARAQGKFWEMHDGLFADQRDLTRARFVALAQGLGLDLPRFEACLEARETAAEVEADRAYGASVGVTGTPTTFINGKRVSGYVPYEQFKPLVEAALPKP